MAGLLNGEDGKLFKMAKEREPLKVTKDVIERLEDGRMIAMRRMPWQCGACKAEMTKIEWDKKLEMFRFECPKCGEKAIT